MIGENIKKLRKELRLTQEEFAKRIGSTQNNLTRYENNRVTPSAPVVTFICRTFHVNEEWLRSGVGEMFLKSDGTILSELADEFNLNDGDKELITAFLNLTDEQRELILKAICDAADKIRSVEPPPATPPAPVAPEDVTVDNMTAEEKEIIKKYRIDKNEKKIKIKGDISGGTFNF